MARMKYPGTKKARCAPEKKENFTMSRLIKQEQLGEKLKSSVKKPVCISLRKYREIFGDSDEEVLHQFSNECLFHSFVYEVCSLLWKSKLDCFVNF